MGIKSKVRKIFKNTKFVKSRHAKYLFNYDFIRFSKFTTTYMDEHKEEYICSKMRILVHVIEKALSLPNPRPGFGKDKVVQLIKYLNEYEKFDKVKDNQVTILAKSAIMNYIEFNEKYNIDVSFIPSELMTNEDIKTLTGTITISKDEQDVEKMNFEELAYSRHSSRIFSSKKIDIEKLKKAVRLAQTSPSACNRQSVRVHITTDSEKCNKIMGLHGGTRGFSKPGAFIVITSDLGLYESEYERNTCIVDGGIFIMNMLYSLHFYKLAACPLIWGAEPSNDQFMYDLMNIPTSEQIIGLIIVGEYPEKEFKVAKSLKKDLNDILKIS